MNKRLTNENSKFQFLDGPVDRGNEDLMACDCRSENPVRLGEWVEVRVSRTGRLASLEVEDDPPQEILAPGAFTQLSLPLNLYLGGAPSTDMYSPKMKTTASFVGCIQTVILNRREVRNFARTRSPRQLRMDISPD